ncbi:helix-turn-helix domain-containing protein [Pseudomonas jessenii]|uniref:helix-turn-helix domain-containing protein n=1 Tax=Pseudomonas jessenii TaxID=77298 RepID=UPI0030BE3FE8
MNTPTLHHVKAFQTTDVTEQVSASPGWQQHYRQMSPGHFCGEFRSLGLEGVEVYDERLNTRVEQHFRAPTDSLAFCFDRIDNSLYLLNEDCRNAWITPENYQEVAVVFDRTFMARHQITTECLDGLLMVPLVSAQSSLFAGWLSATLTQLAEANCPLQSQALPEQLLEDCLFVFDNACLSLQGEAMSKRSGERALMRKVSEWAADCPEETKSLTELAQVAGVSIRQLQQAFKAFTGIPPTQWLRMRRLNGARRDLLRGDNETVAEVAMHWSFWHLGRFSESYRQLFKEMPSETVKRRRSS